MKFIHLLRAATTGLLQQLPIVGPVLHSVLAEVQQQGLADEVSVLSALLGKPVLPTHAHDDRLADWLTRLSRGDAFAALERDLNQHTVRVYQLPTDLVRLDATTANAYADVLSAQGLLQFGHSKDD